MTLSKENVISDLETGSKSNQLFKSNRIKLLRLWRPLPRLVKILVFLILFSLSVMSCLLIVWPDLLKTNLPVINEAFKVAEEPVRGSVILPDFLVQNKHSKHHEDSIQKPAYADALSPSKSSMKQAASSSLQYRKVEGEASPEEINWERDILNSEVPINEQQKAIIEATLHSWNGYKKYAWGYDTLKPISKSSSTWFGVGLTIIDSLDTLLLMGLEKEFKEGHDWIESRLNFHVNSDVNCFEMTIRVLGGLLSSYHLTRSATLLTKALDVGDRLIHCWDSPSKTIPYSDVNLYTKSAKAPVWAQESSTSEVSTMQLEFRDLSRATGQSIYEDVSFKTSLHLHELTTDQPLVPMFINPTSGRFTQSVITLGARGDSYYEYLLKQHLQTGIDWLKEDYMKAIDAVRSTLTHTTQGSKQLTFIGELLRRGNNVLHPKMDHLVCFLPGTLALGHHYLTKSNAYAEDYAIKGKIEQHLEFAKSLARTCYFMYNLTATGLSPEIAYFNENPSKDDDELQIRPADTHNLLRPEHVESLFYLYHLTKDQQYRDQGWQVFNSFNKYCRVNSGGFTSIGDVRDPKHLRPKDNQESFWIAETLKYLYLLFSDDEKLIHKILNHYIFNTEGHLVKRYQYPIPRGGSS